MATVKEMLRRCEAVDLTELTGQAMVKNKQQVLDVNREQLYEKGIGKDGQPLPKYSPQYAAMKLRMRGFPIVDGYKTGAMQKAMQLKVSGRQYEIISEVSYAKYYEERRPTSFGLTEEGERETWAIVRPDVVQAVKDKTGLG
jgi:hypothetical protein